MELFGGQDSAFLRAPLPFRAKPPHRIGIMPVNHLPLCTFSCHQEGTGEHICLGSTLHNVLPEKVVMKPHGPLDPSNSIGPNQAWPVTKVWS